jgi:RHS repeat-associated protein
MKRIQQVLFLIIFFLLAGAVHAQGGLSGVIPTDPSLNRVNWALASKGATATGGSASGGLSAAALINGLSSTFSQWHTLTISPQQYLVIDLGQQRALDGVQVRLYDGDDRYFRFRIEQSADGQTYLPLVDKSVGEHRGIVREDFAPIQTRFLRLYGTYTSQGNNVIHFIDEIFAYGSESVAPHQPEVISVDAIADSGTSSNFINTAQVRTLHAGIYSVAFQSGASSIWNNDSANNGRTWQSSLNVSVPMLGKQYAFGFTHDQFSRYATAAQAEAAALGSSFTIYLPVEAPVYFWFDDPSPADNRGSVAYTLTQVSGPNSSLLAQVRDSMTRSVLWQQRAVANWQSWVTTSNANCFGCHIQTQATVGLNESKAKLSDLPVDDKLLDKFVSAYSVWQNSAGWVSPFHNSYYRTQTSLWAWAVQSFSGARFTQITGNLISALNWLVSQQGPGGGWFWDHDSNILWSDTAGYNEPSATHTAGNIEALATLIERVQTGNFIPIAGANISANEVIFTQNSANVVDFVLVPESNITGLKVTVLDAFSSTANFVVNELEIFNQFAELSVSGTQANFSQASYPIANTINDIRDVTQDGWAYSPGNVLVNPAQGLWKFSLPQTLDRVRLTQIYPAHQLERLRIEVTTDPNPTLSSNFVPVAITDVGLFEPPVGFLTALKNAANRLSGHAGGAWTYNRSVRTAAQTIIGLFEALPHLNTAEATTALARIEQAATFLRSIQRADGGWGENTNGADSSRVYSSAQALRALLLVTNQGLDPQLARGAEYLLNRQYGDGFWKSASFQTDLAATTWVEIALPTLFEVLQNQYERSRINDLMTFSLQGAVELSWSPIPGAASYTIFRRTEGTNFFPIQTGYVNGVVSYTDTDVVDEQTYYYMVRWVDSASAESADSNEASGTPYGMQCGQDSPPQIISHPQTGSSPGYLYGYQLEASDPDVGDVLSYSLVTGPQGMSMSPAGLVQWTPSAQQAGSHFVRVKVEDSIGRFATQAFRVEVTPIFINFAPQFVSNPVMQAYEGNPYAYNSEALDPNVGDVLTYSIDAGPQGMNINPTTGRLAWTPSATQLGMHNVAIRARDIAGLVAQQSFTLEVLPNAPPQFVSAPVISTSAIGLYFYNAEASDPEGAALTFSKVQGPLGLSIHPQSGVVTWTPNQSLIGSYPVVLRVRDPAGLTATQSYTLEVRNHEPPVFSSQPVTSVELGSQYSYQVSAFDPEAGSVSISLVNGPSGMQLSGSNSLTWTPPALATDVPVRLRAIDNLGAETFQDFTVDVVPVGTGGPGGGIPGGSTGSTSNGIFVGLDSPVPGAALTAPVTFVGEITEVSTSYGSALTWVAEFRREGDASGIQIGSGVGAGQNINFGSIDPGVLADDSYRLYVIVDTPTHLLDFWFPYTVETRKKMGEFSISVTDFSIPLTGISLNVSRQYRSFDRSPYEFGHGWRMQVPGRVVDSVPEQPLSPMFAGARVFVTRPDGKRVGFTFMPYPVSILLPFHVPYFRPDPGVTDSLEVPGTFLFKSGIFYYEFVDPFNPTEYYLTTKDRLRYLISETEGLKEIRDPNFNTLSFTAGSIVHSSGQSVSIQRDAAQRITRIIVPGGDDIEYLYDASGNLIRVTNTLQQHTHYTYDSANRLLTIRDASNALVLTNVYDANGRLQKQIDALGHEIQLGIDTINNRETIIDRRGNTSVYQYDSNGNLTQVTDALGGVRAYTYDQNFNRTSETDSLGRTTSYTYDGTSNLLSVTNALGGVTTYSYNSFGQVTSETNPLGITSSKTYSPQGLLLSEANFAGQVKTYQYDAAGNEVRSTNALGQQTQFAYNSLGHITSITDPSGQTAQLVVDQKGNLLSKTQTRTTPAGVETLVSNLTYDTENRLLSASDPEGYQTLATYDSEGRLRTTTDKNGNTKTLHYNAKGQRIKITYPDASEELFGYDPEGNLIQSTDRMGRVTQYQYDALNRQIRISYPDGMFSQTEYDAVGNVTAEIDERGFRTEYLYDALNRQIQVKNALNHITQTTHDAVGNVIVITDALGRVTNYQFDPEGRQTRIDYPGGNFVTSVYDAEGREIAKTDELGRLTQYEYDWAGRVTKVIDALGGQTQYAYDEVGNKISQTDANGHQTLFAYDKAGRLIKKTLPLGMFETFTYDGNGNQLSHVNLNGQTITRQYNSNNFLLQVAYPASPLESFVYQPDGLRTSASDAQGTTTYQYDTRGRLTTVNNPDGTSITYGYDAAGNRTSLTTPSGATSYVFDALNRIAQATDSITGVVNYLYDAVGNQTHVQYPNDLVTRTTFDNLNRKSVVETLAPGNLPLQRFSYTYDLVGNRTGITELDGTVSSYAYDALYRLVSEQVTIPSQNSDTTTYTYDATGNRLTENVNGNVTTFLYDANDRLLSKGATTFLYDNAGNTLQEISAAQTKQYSWNALDRLVALNTGSSTWQYAYDADGIRRSSTSSGVTRSFLVDHNQDYPQVLEERLPGNITDRRYVFGDDLLAQVAGSDIRHFHSDALGSTRALSGAAPSLSDTYRYSAFGAITAQTGGSNTRYLFTGEQRDAESGNYYLRARSYHPGLGRFISADKFEFSPSYTRELNRYAYVANNPATLVDPSGEVVAVEYSVKVARIQAIIAPALRCVGAQVTFGFAEQGVYLLIGEASSYVGQSKDVKRRVAQHLRGGVKQFFDVITVVFRDADRGKIKLAREQLEQLIIELLELDENLSNKVRRPAKRNPLKLKAILDRLKKGLC